MRRFETIFITDPELPDETVNGLSEQFSAAITEGQGEVLATDDWGRRKLAYEVKKQREGRFVRMEYQCEDAALPHELERRMRLSEPVLKYLTVRIDNDTRRLVWEEKQAEKARLAPPPPVAESPAEVAAGTAAVSSDAAVAPASAPETGTAPVPAAAPAPAAPAGGEETS